MTFTQEFLASAENEAQAGALRSLLDAARVEAARALTRIASEHRGGGGPRFLGLPLATEDRAALEREAASLRGRFGHLVVIGTGGSSLGAQTIAAALAPGLGRGRHRLGFLDNVDPRAVTRALDALDLAGTGFLVISKSGNTAETIALTFAVLERLAAHRPALNPAEHVRFVVEPGDSPLRRLAAELQAPVLDHDPKLGGRFSVLSLVGLLPALFLGLDAWGLRAGAASVLERALGPNDPAALPAPAEAAARAIALIRHQGLDTHVLMNYADALEPFGLWWRQLVGESLGKDGRGITPVTARGTTDQHSQLQLYLAGPADKFYTFIDLAPPAAEARFGRGLAEALGVAYLGGQSLGSLFAAEARATAESLVQHGRPVRRIALARLDAPTLGGLFMHFMLEVVLMAELLGVNAFDQPAVEHGKRLVVEILGGAKP